MNNYERIKEMTFEEAHYMLEYFQGMMTQDRFFFEKKIIELNGKSIEAVEKQIPQKVKIIDGYDRCPTCTSAIIYHAKYCYNCGQRLDWSTEDDV